MLLRNQLMVGRGSPVAIQSRTAVLPSLAATIGLGTRMSGTTGEWKEVKGIKNV